ncbi:MAG: sugar ABC transporter permease [Thermogemmatispora sp.]|uniref:carbohydrate ABC transporter permease n=1 Tax=Thermogemmatispora sp. TaxID=1968838 RepID=UPI00262FBDF2|nr:sugar ABC transporter permease [Thermogemmatispora sp.]MBX5455751.1 sugar ABC transporter permease [Thermogemmatispora sp.]
MSLSSSSSSPLSPAQESTPLLTSDEGLMTVRWALVQRRGGLRRRRRWALWRQVQGYLFLLPALLIFALFVWYPVVLGFVMSFQSVDLINPATWVGWANYRHVFADPLFAIAWRNTLAFTGYALLFGYLVPLVLALAINEMRHGKSYFRLAFYLPVMLPPIVTVFLWRWMYDPDSGLLNALLSLVHLPGRLWLEDPQTALPALVVVATWSAAGSTMLVYLAALQGVPASLYEAAEIDGAGFWRRLWHVTLPCIRPIMLLMLVLQIIATMQVFIEPFTITDGGPQHATLSILLLIYTYAFQNADFGEASALSVLLFLVLAAFGLIYLRLTSRMLQGD